MTADDETGRQDAPVSSSDVLSDPAAEAFERLELGKTDRRALLERLDDDERIQSVLRGRLMDYEPDDDDRERREESRTRKMASHGRDLLTVVTTQRLLIVVQRELPADHEYRSIPDDELERVTLETANGNQRLVVRGANRYYIDVSRSPTDVASAACTRLRQRLEDQLADEQPAETTSAADQSDDDPLETIERLATLFEQGHLTEQEFAAKKRELLDRI
ncbi:SHOCT domain-containing protein [Natronorubrum thiooxidans]|uniref:Short C-terminal domain-containing protein n=1 Tax=Natronorubrum thiooxidans TaxID=308853 RepID=A0A1N7GXJ1_9EURY|nr:SHOCT domain-containing protein [Natronorubrum thiooxidans]SIS17294.1 Short C-terminal domain-containing protein [Natronorubrum thiooxidans]